MLIGPTLAKKVLGGYKVIHGWTRTTMGNKQRRTWKPNVVKCALYSETLDKRIQFILTTQALRNIDFHGGLDNYLLKDKRLCEVGKTWRSVIEQAKSKKTNKS